MGKNPYFIGKIGQLATATESSYISAYYNNDNSESECVISAENSTGKYTITGINRQGYTNSMDNNHIGNIGAIELQMDMSRFMLHVRFKYA